ncbi:hypothetical protein [Roseibium sp. MMSF_3544]|uniref:hypothetical protein n=1 Tax=unclassified Roseibium TaxID=2629323 RepID=UPI00273FC47B|nr:hypothetical protein [Roseibium sp. MMSF_3544]
MNSGAQAGAKRRRPGPQGWLGVTLIIAMSWLATVAAQLPPPQFEPVGARLFALAIPIVLVFLGAVLTVQDVLLGSYEQQQDESLASASSIAGSAALLCVLAFYAFLVSLGLSPIVYILISGVFAGCVSLLASRPAKAGIVALATVAGTLLAAGIAWSFTNFLYVDIVS